jgi:hypothetical protein
MGDEGQDCPLLVYFKSYRSDVEKYLPNTPLFQSSNILVVSRAYRL